MTRTLSAWAAFTHAVASVRDNLRIAFRVSWLWYAVILLATAGLRLMEGAPQEGAQPSPSLSVFASTVLVLIASSSIAVTWHRYILLDEIPLGRNMLRLDSVTWRYLGNLLLIGLIVFAAMIPLSVIAAVMGVQGPGLILIILIAVPFAGLLFLRFGIKLPAVALDDRNFGLKDAWRATSGNSAQILALFVMNIAVALALSAVIYAVEKTLGLASAELAAAVAFVLEIAANWVMTIFGITMLTSLYGFFVQNRDF